MKKSSVYRRAGCGEALTVEIAADFFFFFSTSRSLSLPLACSCSRKRGATETEREKEESERRRQQAHSKGEKSCADDEIGGAAERANQSLFHHMSNTARNCICAGDGGKEGRKGGREHKMGGRWRHRKRERARESEGGKHYGRGGGRRMTE